MHARIFTLRFNPVTESFDNSAVEHFLADKEVLSIRDHFFVNDDVPLVIYCFRLSLVTETSISEI